MLLTPDGGFNRGSVVGKRVPGTWSRVLDVLVLWTCCVDDVRPSGHTGRAPGGDTSFHDIVTDALALATLEAVLAST